MTNITLYEFFFDGQQKRYLEQIVRAFSGFQWQTGLVNGVATTNVIPCHMASSSRQAMAIRSNGSENTLNPVPMIVVYQTGLRGRREDLQSRTHIDHLQVFERNINGGKYGSERGNAYSVDRLMPVPFNMDLQVDIWTSNLEQKHQIVEQIMTALYPDFQLQNSENALDWTANTICIIDDDFTWSSITMPVGTENDIDIFSMKLRIPIWLTPPAKVRKLTRIEEVVATVGDLTVDGKGEPDIGTIFNRTIVTPGDCCIRVNGDSIILLSDKAHDLLPDGSIPSWINLFKLYGIFAPNVSELRLLLTPDIEGPFVTGTMDFGSAPNEIIWTLDVDTLPSDTLPPINAVINPLVMFPGHTLPSASIGTRYLVLEDIGTGGATIAWGNLSAHAGDIIQYSGSSWQVIFDGQAIKTTQYLTNLYNGNQYKWDGSDWYLTLAGQYEPGYWRLAL